MYTKFSGELPRGCLPKNGFWYILLIGKQLHTGVWYLNRVFGRRYPIHWAAPLKIWWRWVYSFRDYSRGVYPKIRILHKKQDLVHFTHWLAAPHRLVVLEWGLCQRVSPPPGQLPWKFGRDEPFPSGATLGVFAQKWALTQKNGIWHILLTGKQLPTGA